MLQKEQQAQKAYRERFDTGQTYTRAKEIPDDAKSICLWRKGASHKGISQLNGLSHLTAVSVNDDFIREISTLESLDSLVLSKVKVSSIESLANLRQLRYLRFDRLSPCEGLETVRDMVGLRKLWFSNCKDITDFSFLTGADRIVALGIEGDIWNTQNIDSLKPLTRLKSLEALFMSSVRLTDKHISCMASAPLLKYFCVSRFAPKSEFEELHRKRPDMVCQWFTEYDV